MELVEQHALPGLVQRRGREVEAAQQAGRHTPQLGSPERELALAVAALGLGLRGVHAAVALEVELADVAVLGPALGFLVLEELHRRRETHLRHALEVLQPPRELEVVAGRPAAAVAVAEGIEPGGEAVLLDALVPALDHALGVDAGVVVVVQVDVDLGAVDALPDEGVVGEGIAAVVGPEDLLRGEVLDAAAAHDLRQRAGVAEDVGQPQQLAVDAELLLEEALAVDELADQALAAGDVGVGLDPRRPLRDELARRRGLLDPRVDVGVALLQHPVEVRLALQELELGVLGHQRQLGGEGPPDLALGLLQRPEPRHVEVGVAEGEHLGRGRAVDAGHQRRQPLAARAHGLQHLVVGQLEVDDQREIAQPRVDLLEPQAVLVEVLARLEERLDVEPELVDILLPDAERGLADHLLGGVGTAHRTLSGTETPRRAHDARLGDGVGLGKRHLAVGRRRPAVDEARPVARVALDQHLVAGAGRARSGQRDLGVAPVARACGLAVHPDDALTADLDNQHNTGVLGLVGKRELALEPPVLPHLAPGRARGHRCERPRPAPRRASTALWWRTPPSPPCPADGRGGAAIPRAMVRVCAAIPGSEPSGNLRERRNV